MAKRSQHRVSGGPEPVANVRRQGMGSPERAAKKGVDGGRGQAQVDNLCYLDGEGGLEVE